MTQSTLIPFTPLLPPTPPDLPPPPHLLSSCFVLFLIFNDPLFTICSSCLPGCGVIHWSVGDSPSPRGCQLSIVPQLGMGVHESPHFHAGMLTGLALCRRPQLLWVHEDRVLLCSGDISLILPDLQLGNKFNIISVCNSITYPKWRGVILYKTGVVHGHILVHYKCFLPLQSRHSGGPAGGDSAFQTRLATERSPGQISWAPPHPLKSFHVNTSLSRAP